MKPTSGAGQVDLPVPGSRQAERATIDFTCRRPQRQGSEAVSGQGPARPEALGKACHAQYDKRRAMVQRSPDEARRKAGPGAARGRWYLNNVIRGRSRKAQILIKPVRGFKSIPAAYATIKGIRSHASPAQGRARPGACSPASGARCCCGRLLALGLGADGGMGMLNHHFAAAA